MSAGSFEYYKDQEKTRKNRIGEFFTVGDVGELDEDGWYCSSRTGRST